jgi:hypothetical protein
MRHCEIKNTQYDDPEQTTGQHTNGPQNIFVRFEGQYYLVLDIRSQHKVRSMIAQIGFEAFTEKHCEKWVPK